MVVERRTPEGADLRKALNTLIENGSTLERDGSVITLFDAGHQPVVEINGRQKFATFLDDFHQTAGAIPELQPLIASLDGLKFEVHMD